MEGIVSSDGGASGAHPQRDRSRNPYMLTFEWACSAGMYPIKTYRPNQIEGTAESRRRMKSLGKTVAALD
jgi:hypothetical protein